MLVCGTEALQEYIIKHKPDGPIDWYNVCLIARGFTQMYGVDYTETFSPVVRLNFLKVLLSIVVN